jgi:carbonic anhydrase/acetyltransferase-like protein (isoleucine patch superfamily)
MGAIIMDNAVIEDDCIVAAGALVTQGTTVPAGSLVMGSPARVIRPLKPDELEFLKKSAANYVGDSVKYQAYVQGPKKLGDDQHDLETFGNGFENEFDGE